MIMKDRKGFLDPSPLFGISTKSSWSLLRAETHPPSNPLCRFCVISPKNQLTNGHGRKHNLPGRGNYSDDEIHLH